MSVLSGGVDSSTVTVLGHKALGNRLKTVFIENGLMRENEPENIVKTFKKLKIKVEVINAKDKFFRVLKGKTDPKKKEKQLLRFFIEMFSKTLLEKIKLTFCYKEQF